MRPDYRERLSAFGFSRPEIDAVEFVLLRRGLNKKIGQTGLPSSYLLCGWAVALLAAGISRGLLMVIVQWPRLLMAVCVLGLYGLLYLAGTTLLQIPETQIFWNMLKRFQRKT